MTVAFPFSRIDIHEPFGAMAELAELISQLAGQVAAVSHEVAPGQAEAADRLVKEAEALAARLNTP